MIISKEFMEKLTEKAIENTEPWKRLTVRELVKETGFSVPTINRILDSKECPTQGQGKERFVYAIYWYLYCSEHHGKFDKEVS